MGDFQDQFSDFGINEELKNKFINFETIWETKKSSAKSYKIITVVNNDIAASKAEGE